MLNCYTPELGEKVPTVSVITKTVRGLSLMEQKPIEMRAMLSYMGGWRVYTNRELKGRGIRKMDSDSYHVTDLAFKKLEAEYSIRMECHLD